MASLYSIKPNPFINLISVISPVPWVLKWASTSALVAIDARQYDIVAIASLSLYDAREEVWFASSDTDHCGGGCPDKALLLKPLSW
jgi:hypothetical protein